MNSGTHQGYEPQMHNDLSRIWPWSTHGLILIWIVSLVMVTMKYREHRAMQAVIGTIQSIVGHSPIGHNKMHKYSACLYVKEIPFTSWQLMANGATFAALVRESKNTKNAIGKMEWGLCVFCKLTAFQTSLFLLPAVWWGEWIVESYMQQRLPIGEQ